MQKKQRILFTIFNWVLMNGNNSQKFAIQFTSPTTFSLRTMSWQSIDIKGGTSDAWKENGAELIMYDSHYHVNQQFQLIYADGPNKGKIYRFDN